MIGVLSRIHPNSEQLKQAISQLLENYIRLVSTTKDNQDTKMLLSTYIMVLNRLFSKEYNKKKLKEFVKLGIEFLTENIEHYPKNNPKPLISLTAEIYSFISNNKNYNEESMIVYLNTVIDHKIFFENVETFESIFMNNKMIETLKNPKNDILTTTFNKFSLSQLNNCYDKNYYKKTDPTWIKLYLEFLQIYKERAENIEFNMLRPSLNPFIYFKNSVNLQSELLNIGQSLSQEQLNLINEFDLTTVLKQNIENKSDLEENIQKISNLNFIIYESSMSRNLEKHPFLFNYIEFQEKFISEVLTGKNSKIDLDDSSKKNFILKNVYQWLKIRNQCGLIEDTEFLLKLIEFGKNQGEGIWMSMVSALYRTQNLSDEILAIIENEFIEKIKSGSLQVDKDFLIIIQKNILQQKITKKEFKELLIENVVKFYEESTKRTKFTQNEISELPSLILNTISIFPNEKRITEVVIGILEPVMEKILEIQNQNQNFLLRSDNNRILLNISSILKFINGTPFGAERKKEVSNIQKLIDICSAKSVYKRPDQSQILQRVKYSNLQRKMKEILDEMMINYEQEKSVESYIADFYIPEDNVIVEVMGPIHFTRGGREFNHKTKFKISFLKKVGYKVLIVTNNDLSKLEFQSSINEFKKHYAEVIGETRSKTKIFEDLIN